MVSQEVIDFIQSNTDLTLEVLTLKVSMRFDIGVKEAQDAIRKFGGRENSTTTAPSSSDQSFVYQRQSVNGGGSNSNSKNQFNRNQSFGEAAVGEKSHGERYQCEKRLIKMKLERESKKLKKGGVTDFLESKKTNIVSFDKCIDPNLDAETFKSLSILAKKDRTFILYYMYIGLDLDRISVLMNEQGTSFQKIKKMIDKLSKENHPIWVKYSQKHAIFKAYSEKTEEICSHKDPGVLSKILSIFRSSDKSDDNSSQKPQKGSSKNHHQRQQPSNKTSSGTSDQKINLSKLNTEDDLLGQIGSFKYDSKNDQYIMNTTGDFNGIDTVHLRDVNKTKFEQLLNGKPLPPIITGKIDWVQVGKDIVVGARCK